MFSDGGRSDPRGGDTDCPRGRDPTAKVAAAEGVSKVT